MAKIPRRENRDQKFVFQGGRSDPAEWLIDDKDVATSIRNGNSWGRIKNLTIEDLFHIIGFRVGAAPNDNLGPRVKDLQLEDIHALGRAFAKHVSMGYPDMVYSCCCCG